MATVFVVDDSVTITTILTSILELEGHRVQAFNEAQAALDYMQQEIPDVLLLDYHMPVLPAPDFLDRMKEVELKKGPTVIIISGRQDDNAIRSILEKGALAFLMKPIDPQELIDLIGSLD